MLPPVANQFVAGETAAEAVAHARIQRERGIGTMLNLLGSHHGDRATAVADAREYRRLVDDLVTADVDAALSVKPTQLGLDCGETVLEELLGKVLETAADRDVFVWLDMEEHATTDAILDAYERFAREYGGGIGVCLQADRYRTPDDLERVANVPGKVRLVKGGAYDAPAAVARTDPDAIDRAYRDLLERGVEVLGGDLAVATHDPAMIDHATDMIDERGVDAEFQMLMGVRPDAQRDLAADYALRQFVPYGSRWKRWVVNRTRRNVGFAARAVAAAALPASVTVSGLETPGE